MNYFECELYEQTGIEPERHPWLRPVRGAETVSLTRRTLGEVLTKFSEIEALFLNSSSALARMEEIGTVSVKHARAAGLVGLAARASGIACDVRADYPYGIYRYSSVPSPTLDSGDVYARANSVPLKSATPSSSSASSSIIFPPRNQRVY